MIDSQIDANSILQIHHVNFTLKQRGNGRFHVVLTWNARGMFLGIQEIFIEFLLFRMKYNIDRGGGCLLDD